MNRKARSWVVGVLVSALAPSVALAQPRGRTDGPEGSEYGKGGYSGASDGRFGLTFDWGAAVVPEALDDDPPLFVGVTATYGADEWYALDLSGAYLFGAERFNLVLGPRFRSWGAPLTFNAGLQAGAIFLNNDQLRFGLVPKAGLELAVGDNENILAGLNYALDIPLTGEGDDLAHRFFMSVGVRF